MVAAMSVVVGREKGEELRAAVEEWQDKRNVPQPRLTTGFLDGIQPIVDSYELKVGLLDPPNGVHKYLETVSAETPTPDACMNA